MSKWISTKIKLPNSDTMVLVLLAGRCIRVSYYFEDSVGSWFSDASDIWDQRYGCSPEPRKGHEDYEQYVTHWMPLPEIDLKETK